MLIKKTLFSPKKESNENLWKEFVDWDGKRHANINVYVEKEKTLCSPKKESNENLWKEFVDS